jgi:hypothetical protein
MMDESFVYDHWSEKEKWHEYCIHNEQKQYTDVLRKHSLISIWITENVDGPFRHARWTLTEDLTIKVKFRYEKNLISFMLKWA